MGERTRVGPTEWSSSSIDRVSWIKSVQPRVDNVGQTVRSIGPIRF